MPYRGPRDDARISDLRSATAHEGRVDFNLAYIGRDFPPSDHPPFDTAYVLRLFDYGDQAMRRGNVWRKAPPGENDVVP